MYKRQAEVQRAIRSLEKGDSAEKVLESLARAITNKLTHSPSVQMKKASAEGRNELLRLTQELFGLDNEDEF